MRIRSNVTVLSEAELEAIHGASVRILERTGIRVPQRHCLEVMSELGARADFETGLVRIPEAALIAVLDRIRAAAETAPEPEEAPQLTGWISTQVNVVDYRTNTRRPGTVKDILKGIALVERLAAIPLANAVVLPSEAPAALADVVAFALVYLYSRKPGGTFVLSPFSARHILAMADAMDRKARFLLDTVSPLQYQESNLEIACAFARAGHPIGVSAMVLAGGTGPVTLAGALALENAETLATLFLVYGLGGGAPRYTAIPHSLDLRSMTCSFGSPNQALFGIAVAQLARRYGLIPETNAGLTDSLRPDFQAGYEKGLSSTMAALAGVRAIGAQGLAGADQGFSFEQLVLDNEWLETYNYAARGFAAGAEELAEDVIHALGPGGSYLGADHTAQHTRTSYRYSKLVNRDAWERWQAKGCPESLDRAAEFVASATAGFEHSEPVCPPSRQAAIREIVAAAFQEAGEPPCELLPPRETR